jgi:hypothetical protein
MRIPTLVPILFALLALLLPSDVVSAHPPAQAPGCTTASPSGDPSIGPTPTVCYSREIVASEGSNPDNRFYVSWISSSAEQGAVQIISGKLYPDTCSECSSGTLHYVRVDSLQTNTTYQFDIISGGRRYDNTGSHWQIPVGPFLAPPPPFNILGSVKNPDGSDASEALVYVTIQRADGSGTSSLLSQLMTGADSGFFHLSLSDARTTDYSSRFGYSSTSDNLTITAIGLTGSVSWAGKTGDPRPGKRLLILTLGSGGGTVATATPSPIPSTSTPTPVTPTVTQTLPPATATVLAATETAAVLTSTPTFTLVPPATTAPRATATRQLFIEPTLTAPLITIAPAATTSAQATLASTEEATSEPSTTRVIRLATATPAASSAFAGIVSGGSIFAVLAVVAFIGAAILGVAALYVWRK